MEISTVDSNGRIQLPKWVREKMGICEGDKIVFVEKDGHFYIEKEPEIDYDELRKIEEEFKSVREAFEKMGYTEEQMEADLERVRKEMWEEHKQKYTT